MFTARNRVSVAILCLSVFGVTSCGPEKPAENTPHLLVYCGITMIGPMTEIAEVIEQRHGCVIRFTKGGSGNLQHALEQNRAGDLYLPGASSYMDACLKDGLVKRVVRVGFNQAALVVPKGNPLGLSNDPIQLADPKLGVVLADPASGSIGREAAGVLSRRGCLDQVVNNVMFFTTDSKDITAAIKNGEADVGINWLATSRWSENIDVVDCLPIDPSFAPKRPLLLGLLDFSESPEIAVDFMNFAEGPEGREIFERWGFLPGDQAPRGPGEGDD